MATRGAIVGAIALLILFALAAGCTFRTGDGGPPATGTPSPETAATPAVDRGRRRGGDPGADRHDRAHHPEPDHGRDHGRPDGDPDAVRNPDRDAGPGRDCGDDGRDDPGTRSRADRYQHDRRGSRRPTPSLSRFTQALRQGGIYETLNGTGTYTVFAPNDAAFDAVPPGTLSRLLFDRDALATVADYHVIYGRWLSTDLAHESSVATRSGAPLPVTVLPDGTLQVDDARVVRADIVATNGVLHVVDRVMIPPGAL